MHTDTSLAAVRRFLTDFSLKMSQVEIPCDPWQIGHGECVAVNAFPCAQPSRRGLCCSGVRLSGVATDVVMAQFAFFSRKSNKWVYGGISLLGIVSSHCCMVSGFNLDKNRPMIIVFDVTGSPKFFNARRCCFIVSIKFTNVSGVSLVSLG